MSRRYAMGLFETALLSGLRRTLSGVSGLLLIALSTLAQGAEPLRIAVAANFQGTLQQLTTRYGDRDGQRFLVSSGASGALYAQIHQAAPFDLFFSADADRPERLVAEGLALADSRFTYAVGVPVLWSIDEDRVDDQGDVLKTGAFRHLTIADPRTAPYGAAAREVMESLGIWEDLNQQRRLVRAQSIGQAYGQVASGAAPLGFVALSQIRAADGTIAGSHWIPPAQSYTPIVQQAVILRRAEQNPQTLAVARAFMDWLASDEARAVIVAAGYGTAESLHLD